MNGPLEYVVDALAADGRLDNTLLVFTADNGVAWGAHRLPRQKQQPYTTPVPLYFSFPARWGEEPRRIDSLVSNIDLAPTFCELAGNTCHLGPYPDGQEGPDGVSVLPLIDEQPLPPWRHSVLESNFADRKNTIPGFVTFRALRTDAGHPLGAWHYVERGEGFIELYDLASDPYELENVAGSLALTGVQEALAIELAALWQEGRAQNDRIRPDALVGKTQAGVFNGSHIYAADASTPQMMRYGGVGRYALRKFWVQSINRSSDLASITFTGQSTGTAAMAVSYWHGGQDVTSAVTGSGLVVPDVRPGNFALLQIRIKAQAAPRLTSRTAVVTVQRADDPQQLDVIRAVMSR